MALPSLASPGCGIDWSRPRSLPVTVPPESLVDADRERYLRAIDVGADIPLSTYGRFNSAAPDRRAVRKTASNYILPADSPAAGIGCRDSPGRGWIRTRAQVEAQLQRGGRAGKASRPVSRGDETAPVDDGELRGGSANGRGRRGRWRPAGSRRQADGFGAAVAAVGVTAGRGQARPPRRGCNVIRSNSHHRLSGLAVNTDREDSRSYISASQPRRVDPGPNPHTASKRRVGNVRRNQNAGGFYG